MVELLRSAGVQVSSLSVQSSNAAVVLFEIVLASPPQEQGSALVDFDNSLSGANLTFDGSPIHDGSRGIISITNSCKQVPI